MKLCPTDRIFFTLYQIIHPFSLLTCSRNCYFSYSYVLFCRYDYSGYGQSSGKVRWRHLNSLIYLFIYKCKSFLFLVFIEIWAERIIYGPTPFVWLQPSEQNTYSDIEAAYKCLEESYGTRQEDVILYGQSVGSGPTLDLAARLPQLRAVVLHSPILSGLRVMYPVKRTYWFDIYKVNIGVLCFLAYCSGVSNLRTLLICTCLLCIGTFSAEYWQNSTGSLPSSHHSCKNFNYCQYFSTVRFWLLDDIIMILDIKLMDRLMM